MESNALRYFLNMSRAWLFVFNTRGYIYSKCKAFHTKKCNESTSDWRTSTSRLYRRTQEKIQHSSAINKQWITIVSLSKVHFAY